MGTKVKIMKYARISYLGHCAIILVFDLFVLVFANTNGKCATLYNSYSYQGSPLSLTDGSKQANLRNTNYKPQSIKITPGCFLTMFDAYGYQLTVDRDSANLGWFSYSVLDAACCECGGCIGAANKLTDDMCARLFENQRCDACSGYRLDLKSGDQARNFGPVNNKMTSVAIKQGCTLTVFYDQNFQGWRFNFTQSNNMIGANWYKQISSAKCGCDSSLYALAPTPYPGPPWTLSTVSPTRPPMTLPTIPTTRVPITLPVVPTRASVNSLEGTTYPYFGGSILEEIRVSTTPTTTTTTIPSPSTKTTTTTTTTTPYPTTRTTTTTTTPSPTRTTTTTTESPAYSSKEGFDFGWSKEEEEEKDDEDEDDFYKEEVDEKNDEEDDLYKEEEYEKEDEDEGDIWDW